MGAGGWYVNGSFTKIGGKARNGLARVLADLSVDDAWIPPFRYGDDVLNGPMIVSGGRVYVASGGGQFLSRPLRIYDATTGAEISPSLGSSGRVHAMVLSGSTLYIGG